MMMNYGISECANFQTQQHEILDGLPLPSILIPNVAGNVHQFSLKSPMVGNPLMNCPMPIWLPTIVSRRNLQSSGPFWLPRGETRLSSCVPCWLMISFGSLRPNIYIHMYWGWSSIRRIPINQSAYKWICCVVTKKRQKPPNSNGLSAVFPLNCHKLQIYRMLRHIKVARNII